MKKDEKLDDDQIPLNISEFKLQNHIAPPMKFGKGKDQFMQFGSQIPLTKQCKSVREMSEL